MSSKRGIDVSKWNVITDYDAARNAGVEFAVVRALQGSGATKDPLFETHVDGFNSSGIPVIAAYNYAYCNTEESAKRTADAFVTVCDKKNIGQVELDLEDACMMGLGKKIIPIIRAYQNVANSAGMTFGIYTGAQFYNPYLKPYVSEIGDVPIWWARYPYTSDRTIQTDVPSTSFLPTGVPVEGWQYSSKGRISGVNGYVDLDVWYNVSAFTNKELSPAVTSCVYREPVRTLYRGHKGDDVRWVQWHLWRFGCFLDANGQPDINEIDGVFGAKTQAAVVKAQRNLGMTQTGYVATVDRAIWKKLV